MRHDESDAAEAEEQAGGLAPGHPLAEQEHGQDGDEDGIRTRNERGETGGYLLQADIAQAEIECLIGDADDREKKEIAAAQCPWRPRHESDAKDDRPGSQEAR